ncbi:MAG: response regulator, partial [Deltaproteobacteria bacterium]|nr:response regulator [Deltaproteobacteria bacterium]
MKKRILVVDDESLIRESLVFILRKENYEVDEASNGIQALEKIKSDNYDLLITDIEMPELKGIELLEKVRQYSPDTFVILITAYASIETAISAFRKGASDYILKPLEFEDLLHRVKKIFEYKELLQENINLRAELNREYDFQNIIGNSPA